MIEDGSGQTVFEGALCAAMDPMQVPDVEIRFECHNTSRVIALLAQMEMRRTEFAQVYCKTTFQSKSCFLGIEEKGSDEGNGQKKPEMDFISWA